MQTSLTLILCIKDFIVFFKKEFLIQTQDIWRQLFIGVLELYMWRYLVTGHGHSREDFGGKLR